MMILAISLETRNCPNELRRVDKPLSGFFDSVDVISSSLDGKSASPLEKVSRVSCKAADGLGETMTELAIVAQLGFPWLTPERSSESILGLA